MTPLRQRFLDELTRRNYSPRTIEAYLAGVVRFVRHTRRAPDRASPDDLRAFQLHLVGRQVSWSLFNQTTCALRTPGRPTSVLEPVQPDHLRLAVLLRPGAGPDRVRAPHPLRPQAPEAARHPQPRRGPPPAGRR